MTSPGAAGAENARGRTNLRSRLPSSARTMGVLAWSALAWWVSARPALAQPPPEPPVVEAPEAPDYETVVRPERDGSVPKQDVTASASVITADRTPRSGETLPRLLSELPGAAVTRYGSYGSLATLSLRGSPPNQVAVYVDGVPLAGALTGSGGPGAGAQLASPSGSRSTGDRAPCPSAARPWAGSCRSPPRRRRRRASSCETGGGSFQTRHAGGSVALVRPGGSVVARLTLFRSRADFPYHSDNGTLFDPRDDQTLRRQNNDLEQIDGSLRAALAAGGGRQLWLSLSALQREQGLPARGILQSYATRLGRRRLALSANLESADDLGAGQQAAGDGVRAGQPAAPARPDGGDHLRQHPAPGTTRSPRAPPPSAAARSAAAAWCCRRCWTPATRATSRRIWCTNPSGCPGGASSAPRRSRPRTGSRGHSWSCWPRVRGELAHDQVSPENDVSGQPAATTRPETYLLPIFRAGRQPDAPPRRAPAGQRRPLRPAADAVRTVRQRRQHRGQRQPGARERPERRPRRHLADAVRRPGAPAGGGAGRGGVRRRLEEPDPLRAEGLLRRLRERRPGAQPGGRAVAGPAGACGWCTCS